MLIELWGHGVRNLGRIAVRPGPGLNVFLGANGSGKTSLLEGCFVLGVGRSFRTPRLSRIVGTTGSEFLVAAQMEDALYGSSRVAVQWDGRRRSRLNGEWTDGHWEIVRRFPVLVVHAGSFALLTGVPEERRRLLDWGGFYLDPDFALVWQNWRRAHEQRNAALKRGDSASAERFEKPAALAGTRLNGIRQKFAQRLGESLRGGTTAAVRDGLPGEIVVGFRQGWSEGESLLDAYRRSRGSDLDRGYGQVGPQKADLDVRVDDRPVREASRGEQKRVLNALVISQGLVQVASSEGRLKPLLLLDDAVAEMDEPGLGGVMDAVLALGWQCFATTVDENWARAIVAQSDGAKLFHVKHGAIAER